MGWNAGDVLIEGSDLSRPGAPMVVDTATTGAFGDFPVAATVRTGDGGQRWVQVHFTAEVMDQLPRDATAFAEEATGRVIAAYYSSAAEVYLLEVADAGTAVRSLVLSEREVAVDEGDPLDVEEVAGDMEEDPENWVFEVVGALTGVVFPTDDHDAPVWHPVVLG